MCAHAGQATPVAPNPRVLVSGQPTVAMSSAYVRGRLHPAAAGSREWTVRHRTIHDGGH